VYLRLLGPVVLANSSANAARPILSEPRWTMGQFRGEIVTRLDRAADFPVPGRNLHAPALAGHGLPVEAWSEDDDIRLVGNAAPQWVLNDLELVADFLSVTRPEDSARLRRAAPALSPWLARGAINAIGRDEVEEVLLASRACAVEVLAVEFAGQTRLPYLRRWIDELALPLLRRNDPLPEDDADAFTNLQP